VKNLFYALIGLGVVVLLIGVALHFTHKTPFHGGVIALGVVGVILLIAGVAGMVMGKPAVAAK
jgi:hypothetical protein